MWIWEGSICQSQSARNLSIARFRSLSPTNTVYMCIISCRLLHVQYRITVPRHGGTADATISPAHLSYCGASLIPSHPVKYDWWRAVLHLPANTSFLTIPSRITPYRVHIPERTVRPSSPMLELG